MPDRFTFICTKTSAPAIVPASGPDFQRRTHNAFQGLLGGVLFVGDLKDRPNQDAVPNHVLCDGSVISRDQLPELVDLLAGPDALTATLPNYSGAVVITTPTVTQTVDPSGTVSTGAPVVPAGDVGGTQGGNVESGGRLPRNFSGNDEL